jgi:intracellular septation protein A
MQVTEPRLGAIQSCAIPPCAIPSWRSVLLAVARGLVPHLIEATLIPTTLFFVTFVMFGIVPAYIVALTWSYLAVGRRLVAGRVIPTLVLLSGIGITLRTMFALLSGSSFVYFVQPVLGKVVLSAVFLTSAVAGQPLIARFAQDFCAMPPDVVARAGVVRLYRRLTLLWAAINLSMAVVTLVLLLTVPVGAFIAIKSVAGWAVTSLGIVVTVTASVRTAHSEDLFAVIATDGTLSARSRRVGDPVS